MKNAPHTITYVPSDPSEQSSLPAGIKDIYISTHTIAQRIRELAHAITQDYNTYIHALIILKGAIPFSTDLFRAISTIKELNIYHSYIKASSYGSKTTSSKTITISHEIHEIHGKDILIIEDIIDTGHTLSRMKEYLLKERGAKSVRICCLLDKPKRRNPNISLLPEYRGFIVEDYFLVGYGMDYAEQFRHIPYIGILDRENI